MSFGLIFGKISRCKLWQQNCENNPCRNAGSQGLQNVRYHLLHNKKEKLSVKSNYTPPPRQRTLSFLVWPLIPIQCWCKELLSHQITFSDTHTLDRAPMDEGSARRRGLYLHNTRHSQGISMPTVELEPATQESERPQTHASDRAASGIGFLH
jgi:hypothetical protein